MAEHETPKHDTRDNAPESGASLKQAAEDLVAMVEAGAREPANFFASGAITLPLPADAGFCQIFGILGKRQALGHWCGMYPPGWPALLVPGVWLGAPWLVNPLLGALLVVAIAELGRDLFADRTGRIALRPAKRMSTNAS